MLTADSARDRYVATRALTEQLAAPLSPEDQTVQSMPDVSPTKWHRAHVTWFFETFVLDRYADGYSAYDEAYRMLFNSYYEGVGPRFSRAQRGLLGRPGANEVGKYRAHVDAAMEDLLDGPDLDPDLLAELGQIPNIVGVKQAHDDLEELRQIATRTDLALYAGNDDLLLAVAEVGGEGVISVASHLVGEQMAEMVRAVRHGRMDEARAIDRSLADLVEGLFTTSNPILIKAALEMCGLIDSDRMRLPLVTATEQERETLRKVLDSQGVLVRR